MSGGDPSAWVERLRSRFPATRQVVYLNSAAVGPLSFEAARAASGVYESMLLGGDAGIERFLDDVEAARSGVAHLLGFEPRQVGFTRSTSHAASLAAQILWESGCRSAVALGDEFPSSVLPFVQRGFDVQVVPSRQGRVDLDRVAQAMTGRQVLIASHVSYRTGWVCDPAALGRIADAAGGHLVMCVTQSIGALRIDADAANASFVVGTSHKWLCAGTGGGFLGVHRDLLPEIRWPQVGWLSVRDPWKLDPVSTDILPDARAIDAGAGPLAVTSALAAATRLWIDTGVEQVESRVRDLGTHLRERLAEAGYDVPVWPREATSGIAVVPVADPASCAGLLGQRGVASTPRGQGIRLAAHAFNTLQELDQAVRTLLEVAPPGGGTAPDDDSGH